ncbi:hypothetical protein [Azospirillum baldaniorum]|uniref:hypothetical protein n=1 Tax=Azospirillum baldaniorum TaxID=1064539 RepID=UPI001645BF8C|nr:hypothetical protein [Azospirillum baldaniorum]
MHGIDYVAVADGRVDGRQHSLIFDSLIFASRNDPCFDLWPCKQFVAEPRVWTQRSQGKILETFVDLDFMHTNGFGTVLAQDALSLLLLLGRADADPQDEAADSHQRFEFPGPLRSESTADQGADAAPGRPPAAAAARARANVPPEATTPSAAAAAPT